MKKIDLVEALEACEQQQQLPPPPPPPSPHVTFSEKVQTIIFDDIDEEEERRNFILYDKWRFNAKIKLIGEILSPILTREHRQKIYANRFEPRLSSEDVQKLAPRKFPKVKKPLRHIHKVEVNYDHLEYLTKRKHTLPYQRN